jgi:hypothetical protein
MTYDDFKAKHKENVLKGFDDIDGRDYWAEFKADLHTLLADERKPIELQIDELKKALYAECVGQACHDDGECYQGYRQCTGCEIRAKKAYGPGWGGVIEKREDESRIVCYLAELNVKSKEGCDACKHLMGPKWYGVSGYMTDNPHEAKKFKSREECLEFCVSANNRHWHLHPTEHMFCE